MTSLPVFSLDTPAIEKVTVHSGHNFREVAPELLSPFSWSIIGAGMELGFRRAAMEFGKEKPTWPRPHFVSYFGFRPFFNMTSIERLAAELPMVDPGDIWELLLGGPGPDSGKAGRPARLRRLGRLRGLRGALAFVGSNGGAFGQAQARLAAAESAVMNALHSGSAWQAGSACDAAIQAGRTAWELHIRTTSVALIAASVTRQLLTLQYGRDDALQLLRASAQRKDDRGGASARGGMLTENLERLNNYEVADGDGPFASRDHFTAAGVGGDIAQGRSGSRADEISVPLGTALGPVHERVIKALGLALGERERSKEIGLRALHCTRVLLDRGMFGVDAAEAALLGVDELRGLDSRGRKRLADERASEHEEAASTHYPSDVLLHNGLRELHRSRRGHATNVGQALAPGWAEGTLVIQSDGTAGRILTGDRVDGNYVLATLPDGVVSKYGSVLSHVAIVCRELGIPFIAGISPDPSSLGKRAVVDGWTGTVTVDAGPSRRETEHGA